MRGNFSLIFTPHSIISLFRLPIPIPLLTMNGTPLPSPLVGLWRRFFSFGRFRPSFGFVYFWLVGFLKFNPNPDAPMQSHIII